MSTLEVNTINPQSGTTITIGGSGDTVSLGSGATQSGFGGTNTPAFFAQLPSGGQSIANGTGTKLQLSVEVIDTDSAYDNSSNYRFTVPSGKGGKYYITVGVGQASWSAQRVEAQLRKNGGGSVFLCESQSSGSGVYATTNGSVILDLSAGDYLELYLYHNNGGTQTARGSNTEIFTYMGGYRIIGA
jgi:hypothetical protein